MGAGTPVLTAVAITQWSCASSRYLCFSPPLPLRGRWGENERLLVALMIPVPICDWGTKVKCMPPLQSQLAMCCTPASPSGCGIIAFADVLGCIITSKFDPLDHCCSTAKSHPAQPQHIVSQCKGSCPKMSWKYPKNQFLLCWVLPERSLTHQHTHPILPPPPPVKNPKPPKNNPKRLL